jgi:hypothetical protein
MASLLKLQFFHFLFINSQSNTFKLSFHFIKKIISMQLLIKKRDELEKIHDPC